MLNYASHVCSVLINSALPFCHPNDRLCQSLSQSGNVVQAVFVPSMPWWEPANADALDGYADCDPVQLEAAVAQASVVHKESQAPTSLHMSSTAAEQLINSADQVCHTTVQFYLPQAAHGSPVVEEAHQSLHHPHSRASSFVCLFAH